MDRLAILAALALALVLAVLMARGWARARTRRVAATPAGDLWQALGTSPDGRPTIVAFKGPACRECTVQAREIEHLGEPGVRILELDASDREDVARTFGVLTVPTTVVLDGGGRVEAVNHGLAQRATLSAQLARANR